MSLVFYYSPLSSAVTVHWALEELVIPYEKVRVDLQARDQDKPSYRALNPNGKVPLLVHDGTPIFESAAIVLHLGEVFGVERKLFPEPGLRRAEAFKWIVWAGVSLGEAFMRYQSNVSPRVPAERQNAKAAEAAKADVETLLQILDAELANEEWLVGTMFSLADLYVASWASYVGAMGFDPKPWPKLESWLNKCTARPGFGISRAP
jgi:glutathione S-transferase